MFARGLEWYGSDLHRQATYGGCPGQFLDFTGSPIWGSWLHPFWLHPSSLAFDFLRKTGSGPLTSASDLAAPASCPTACVTLRRMCATGSSVRQTRSADFTVAKGGSVEERRHERNNASRGLARDRFAPVRDNFRSGIRGTTGSRYRTANVAAADRWYLSTMDHPRSPRTRFGGTGAIRFFMSRLTRRHPPWKASQTLPTR